jgi:uncharacterized repeat protein (TIGR03803 family)
MNSIATLSTSLKPAVVAISLLMLFLTVTTARAQVETPLFTYPITINNTSGIVWPGLMTQGTDGNFYSTIQTNGAYNFGSVFKMSTTGQYTLIYSFCAELGHCLVTGSIPDGGVTLGTDGNFYGTTQDGGTNGDGTVFKITPGGTLTTLWNFTEGTKGDEGSPFFPPLLGQDSNFYGVDSGIYNTDYGVFYKMTPKGSLTPHKFNFTNGVNPILPVQGIDGNFYGATASGGGGGCECGVIYKATSAGKITKLYTFQGSPDGERPLGVLVQGNDGDFYGTTYGAKFLFNGTVFKISPSGTYTQIHTFSGVPSDGALPETGLTLGSDGNFYGTTVAGGKNNDGSIYQLTPAGQVNVLYSFCSKPGCTDGLSPTTPLVQHTDGKFYGNTSGNSLGGSVFYSFDMGLPPFAQLVLWSGKVGSKAEILGQGLNGTSSVSFSGVPATFNAVSDTYLTATVPVGANTGTVSVVTSGGTLLSSHIFLVVPTIKTISPTSGPVGTAVTITGSGLIQATKVTFGGGAKAAFTVNSDSQITATVPTGAKTGKIVVTTPGGTAKSPASFTVTP